MPTPRADKQAQAAAHRLGKDLAALKQEHWRFASTGEAEDAFISVFDECYRDDRIYHVLYFWLTISQLQILAGRKYLCTPQALPPGPVEDRPDIRDIPAPE